jgi:hypothetical protein
MLAGWVWLLGIVAISAAYSNLRCSAASLYHPEDRMGWFRSGSDKTLRVGVTDG